MVCCFAHSITYIGISFSKLTELSYLLTLLSANDIASNHTSSVMAQSSSPADQTPAFTHCLNANLLNFVINKCWHKISTELVKSVSN